MGIAWREVCKHILSVSPMPAVSSVLSFLTLPQLVSWPALGGQTGRSTMPPTRNQLWQIHPAGRYFSRRRRIRKNFAKRHCAARGKWSAWMCPQDLPPMLLMHGLHYRSHRGLSLPRGGISTYRGGLGGSALRGARRPDGGPGEHCSRQPQHLSLRAVRTAVSVRKAGERAVVVCLLSLSFFPIQRSSFPMATM